MKQTKSRNISIFLSMLAITSTSLIVGCLAYQNNNTRTVFGDEINYSIVMSSLENKLTMSNSYVTGEASIKTHINNSNINIAYNNIKNNNDGFQTLGVSGSIKNIEDISGLKSLTFTSSSANTLSIKYGWTNGVYGTSSTLTPNIAFCFDDKLPSFFEITNNNESDYDITSIRIEYSCVRQDTPVYTVTWENYDNSVLEIDSNVNFGETPTFDGNTPTRPTDQNYIYSFDTWSPSVSVVTSDITYVATYNTTNLPKLIPGGYYTMAFYSSNKLIGWGMNTSGQIGNGTKTNVNIHTEISSDLSFTQIANGENHNVALAADGSVYTWGNNAYYQLGTGNTNSVTTATKLETLGTDNVAIGANLSSSFALKSDGKLYTWGSNTYGQLGQSNNKTPGLVSDSLTFASVYAGTYSTLAIGRDGFIYGTGLNTSGQLGNGSTTNLNTFTKINDLCDKDITSFALGYKHTIAITSEGEAYIFGNNSYGQLGDGSTTDNLTPTKLNIDNKVITSIYAKDYVSWAITSTNELYGWGNGANYILGNNSTSNVKIPTMLSIENETIVNMFTGLHHNFVVTSDGDIYGWGSNSYYQVATTTKDTQKIPVNITL